MTEKFPYRNQGQVAVVNLRTGEGIDGAMRQFDNAIQDLHDIAENVEFIGAEASARAFEPVLREAEYLIPIYTGALADSGYITRVEVGGKTFAEIGFADRDLPESEQLTTETAGVFVGGSSTSGYQFPDSRNPIEYASIVHESGAPETGAGRGFLSIPLANAQGQINGTIQGYFKQYLGLL